LLQKELAAVVNATHCLYYANVLDLVFQNPEMLALLSNKAMENVRKEHMTTFHKILLVCDLTLGPEFFQQVQVQYNMNPDPKMMIEKL
jgi:hypothetical protein